MLSQEKYKMRTVLFWVFTSSFCILLLATLAIVFLDIGSPTPDERALLFKVFIGEVGLAVIALFYSLFEIKKDGQPPTICSVESTTLLLKTYPRSQHPEFFSEVETLVPRAKNIILIATGLNLLWEKHIADMLVARAASGEASVTICLGNPYSPHVEDRLVEEEMYGNKPPVGRDGVARSVKNLVQLMNEAARPEKLSICLFEHYPTFATLIFDQDIFIYPYAYILLGNVSPIFHLCNDGSEEARFFLLNADRIISDAVPAEDVVEVKRSRKYFSDRWIAAAVYVVPNGESRLYKWGSSILGYDVRGSSSGEETPGELGSIREHVGEATDYGFHMTLADALFFATQAELERVKAELRFLAEEFRPFMLSNFRISDIFRTSEEVVMLCDDPSGEAEAIHTELISRMYRVAISSTYLSGKTKKKLQPESRDRTNLMLARYGSPYVIKQFVPHFTLCSSAPGIESQRQDLMTTLNRSFEESRAEKEIEIDEICLMLQGVDQNRWTIHERYTLSGT